MGTRPAPINIESLLCSDFALSTLRRAFAKMASDDLFSFLDDAPPEDVPMYLQPDASNHVTEGRKRKAELSAPLRSQSPESRGKVTDEMSEDGPSTKKTRIASPKLMVVDEVEIEAKREVAASAGLTGTTEAGSRLELRHQVRHQVAVPPAYPYVSISNHVPPAKPAREYKFTLDPFQQVSVYAIQRNESVLVSAHTSAGKTVVAEYAIAQCLQNKQRVIYTSPIKASSHIHVHYLRVPINCSLGSEQPEVSRNVS